MPRHRSRPQRATGGRPMGLALALLAAAVVGVVVLRSPLTARLPTPAAVPTPAPVPAATPAVVRTTVPVALPADPPPAPVPESACGTAYPVVVATGPLARVSVCEDAGELTYRATRASDGASVVLPAERSGTSWTARSGDVIYRLGDGELLITRTGAVLEQQVLDGWWEQAG